MEDISIYEHNVESSELRLYSVDFFGAEIVVTVTSSAGAARRWLSSVLYFYQEHYDHLVAGIGVQWLPGPVYSPASTLQICVGKRCLIYQLERAERVPVLLRRFLQFPTVTLVGIWNNLDAVKLRNSRHGLEVKELIDLRYHVTGEYRESMVQASMGDIVEEMLGYEGVYLDQRVSMSNWEDEDLSLDQVRQACVKAYVAFEIGKNIEAWEISSD